MTGIPHRNTAQSPASYTEAVPVYVAYDISEQRRRNRLHRLLRGFGEPVQKSVFLCWVDGVRQHRLKMLLDDFIRAQHTGQERIDCIPARMLKAPEAVHAWVFE